MSQDICINLTLQDKHGAKAVGRCIIRDEAALFLSNHRTLAHDLYLYEKKRGVDVGYNTKFRTYIQKFPDKSSEEIKGLIVKELEGLKLK